MTLAEVQPAGLLPLNAELGLLTWVKNCAIVIYTILYRQGSKVALILLVCKIARGSELCFVF